MDFFFWGKKRFFATANEMACFKDTHFAKRPMAHFIAKFLIIKQLQRQPTRGSSIVAFRLLPFYEQ
jgi:hypothetical protein